MMIAVWGRNGAGKTTVAANLAAALAKRGAVLLLSCNLWWPEIQLYYGQIVKEQNSLSRLTQEDSQSYELFCQAKKLPNLHLLTWPDNYTDLFGDFMSRESAAAIYEQAKHLGFNYLVVDCSAAPDNALSSLGLSKSDVVLNVCRPAAFDLFWFRAMSGYRAALGVDMKTLYVVNAADGSFSAAPIYGKINPHFELPLVEQMPNWSNMSKLAWGSHRKYTAKLNFMVEKLTGRR